jgi:hypothetical protein
VVKGVLASPKGSVKDYFLRTDEGDFPLMELEFLRNVEGLEDYLTFRMVVNLYITRLNKKDKSFLIK